LGKPTPFEVEYSRRFAWGEVTVGLVLLEGRVQGAKVYSDALDADVIDKIAPALQGEYFSAKALAGRVKNLPVQNELQAQMKADIAALLGGTCED
jgi:lipoate-protein ligase A